MYTDVFHGINIASVCLTLFLCVLLAGIIGLQRGATGHPAGFRTHILVCVGAATAMMTNIYLLQTLGTGDPARLGAQVVTGVGFLGVGTILITGRHKIQGLTTAAGLWASACLGLALGAGFYSGAIAATVVIYLSLRVLPYIEKYFYARSREMDVYVEATSIDTYQRIKHHLNDELKAPKLSTHIGQSAPMVAGAISFQISATLPKGMTKQEFLDMLENMDDVILAEEQQ